MPRSHAEGDDDADTHPRDHAAPASLHEGIPPSLGSLPRETGALDGRLASLDSGMDEEEGDHAADHDDAEVYAPSSMEDASASDPRDGQGGGRELPQTMQAHPSAAAEHEATTALSNTALADALVLVADVLRHSHATTDVPPRLPGTVGRQSVSRSPEPANASVEELKNALLHTLSGFMTVKM